MGQKGFWDEQERREKLNQKKPMLKWLNENINWEDFRPILETIYDKAQVLNPAIKLYIFRRGTTRLSQWTKFHSCRIKICIYRNLSANLLPYIRGTFNSCNIK